MNFQVPQFIEIEDKPIGPFTFKQFIYLAGGAGLCFLFWVYLPWRFLAVILIIPSALFALALAFYKVNNRPFVLILEAAVRYGFTKKLYIWKRVERGAGSVEGNKSSKLQASTSTLTLPRLSQSKLSDLAWSLDIQEKVR